VKDLVGNRVTVIMTPNSNLVSATLILSSAHGPRTEVGLQCALGSMGGPDSTDESDEIVNVMFHRVPQ